MGYLVKYLTFFLRFLPLFFLFAVTYGGVSFSTDCLADTHAITYPTKPIKIVVYTKPGGLIDITARKLASLMEKNLERKGVSQAVVVENKKGAGGLVALNHLTRQPADGHTVLALTSSVISKALQARQEKKLEQLRYLARLVEDYECLIVHKDSKYGDLQALMADAKSRPGKQIWLGPAAGGTDHLFAKKFWKASGGSGRWIPYKSGGEAIAALLGKHGDVYVGNPQDTIGRPDLKILAVASPERLEQFSKVPTFAEGGLPALTGESLWRGLVIPKGIPQQTEEALLGILREATTSKEWNEFVKKGAAQPIFETNELFAKAVSTQIEKEKLL